MASFGLSLAMASACLLSVFMHARAQINIMGPPDLAGKFSSSKGRIEGSTTTIGAPFYGDRVLGQLVYGPSKSVLEPHCASEDYELPKPAKHKAESGQQLINIAIVKRGGCSFSTKVKVAAEKGAHAVIIVDKEDSTFTRNNMKNVIVAEDAYDDDVHIPSIFVCKDDGKILIDKYEELGKSASRSPIVVELAWNVPTQTVVKVDQWMSSASSTSLKFLMEFAPKRKILNQVIKFEPHFPLFSMGNGGSAQTISKLCSDSSGKYCAEDPDGDGAISGKDVLEEDMRQLCLHKLTKTSGRSWTVEDHSIAPEFAAKYWDYIEKFQQRCPLAGGSDVEHSFGEACSHALMREVGVTEAELQNIGVCADVSRNTEELSNQLNHTAWSPRALRINGWRYSGLMDAELVCTAICSGFSKEPAECAQVKFLNRNVFKPFTPIVLRGSGVSFGTLIGWLLVVVAFAGVGFFLYKQYLKKEMRSTIREEVMLEVEAQMGEYGRLRG